MRTILTVMSFWLLGQAGVSAEDLIRLPLDGSLKATVQGRAVVAEAVGTVRFVPGREGRAALLGQDESVRLAIGRLWPLDQGCVEFWVRPDWDATDGQDHWLLTDQAMRFRIFKYTNNRLYLQIKGDKTTLQCFAPCDWRRGEWHHVAGVWRDFDSPKGDGQVLLFIDGDLAASAGGPIAVSGTGNTLLVGNSARGNVPAQAALADVRLRAVPRVDYRPTSQAENDNYALVSQGASVRVSSQITNLKGKSYLGIELIDGRESGGYWAADFVNKAPAPHWAAIDLGQERFVGRVVVYPVRTAKPSSLSLQLQARQGDGWRDLAKSLSQNGHSQVLRPSRTEATTGTDTDSRVRLDAAPAEGLRARYASATGVVEIPIDPPQKLRELRLVFDKSAPRLHEVQVFGPGSSPSRPETSLAQAGPVLRFDFGAHNSPVADGWLPVDESTAFTPQRGYGWTQTAGLLGVDRTEGFALTRDLVAGLAEGKSTSHRFQIRLPNGSYAVAVLAGDLDYPVPAFQIVANSTVVARHVGTGASGACDAQTFVVEVRDGLLALDFVAPEAWAVSGLIVAPVARFADVQTAVDEALDQFAIRSPSLLRGWRQRKPESLRGDLVVDKAMQSKGYVVFSRSYLSPIYPATVPNRAERCENLDLQAAPGEYEPVTLAVRALRGLRDVRLSVGPLQGPAGTIPADQISVRLVRCWPQVEEAWGKDEWRCVPEMLEPQGRHGQLWIRPETTRQFWLTVHVPDEARPGSYQAPMTLTADGAPATQIALRLEVLPIRLAWPEKSGAGADSEKHCAFSLGIYYDPKQEDGGASVLADLRNMRAHGLNAIAANLGHGVRLQKPSGDWDLSYLQWLMGLVQQVGGFTGPIPLYLNGGQRTITPQQHEALLSLIPTLQAERAKRGWPELLYYPVDEPFGGQRLEDAAGFLQTCKEVPGIRTYCTVSGQAAEKLAPWLDVRCHTLTVTNGFVWPEVRDRALADGDEFWWYSNATRHYFAPMRMKAGFFFWKTRATGQTYWHFRNGSGSLFCDFDGGGRDHVANYPGLDGPIDTIQWECHREGLDDARYAYTLESLIASAEKRGVRGEALAKAKRVIAELQGAVNVDLASYDAQYPFRKYAFHYFSDWKPEQFNQYRRRIAAAIVELTQAGPKN